MNQIIGRFVPIGNFNRGRMPFNVLTKVASDYMPPAWKGIREGGEGYHVIEKAWRFEPVEWDGEGLPGVGIKCEHCPGGTTQHEWEVVTVAGIYENLVTGFTDFWLVKENGSSYTVGNPYRFRPIRSEADKKRDEAIAKIIEVLNAGMNTEDDGKNIYDYIAAGKIPHIRID